MLTEKPIKRTKSVLLIFDFRTTLYLSDKGAFECYVRFGKPYVSHSPKRGKHFSGNIKILK